MPDDPTQTISPELTQTLTEPVPPSTADSAPPTIPPVAPEGPKSTVASETSISAPPVLEPQNQTPTPVEPVTTPTPSQQPTVVIQTQSPRSFLAKALEKIKFRKRAKLEKIMKFAQGRKEITNDQVEKLLHISDSTAQRYLIQLAKEGKLKRIGKDGSSRYEPLNGSNGGN